MIEDKLDLFISQTREDIKEIKGDVKSLLQNRWKTEGMLVTVSVIISLVFTVAIKLIFK